MHIRKYISNAIQEILSESNSDYLKWKRKNVTLRGIRSGVAPTDKEGNSAGAKYGDGLYTAFLSNKQMAKEYGDVYFVVGAIPANPKVTNSTNEAEIFLHKIIADFCERHGVKRDARFFFKQTTISQEMQDIGYDGLIIKGREMVNYNPGDVRYFRTENELQRYYDQVILKDS